MHPKVSSSLEVWRKFLPSSNIMWKTASLFAEKRKSLLIKECHIFRLKLGPLSKYGKGFLQVAKSVESCELHLQNKEKPYS